MRSGGKRGGCKSKHLLRGLTLTRQVPQFVSGVPLASAGIFRRSSREDELVKTPKDISPISPIIRTF
ncbi:hypothetical protein NQZ68_029217 [Dissostichus eleginoides]|nr:hypothetical protein NQZ68_029217 [Dissostichus eleginoides]